MKRDLQLEQGETFYLKLTQICRKGSTFSAQALFHFLNTFCNGFTFPEPLLKQFALVDPQHLEEDVFFKCAESHPVGLEDNYQGYLNKCARYLELFGYSEKNPVLVPYRSGSASMRLSKKATTSNSFIHFPSKDSSNCNNYCEKLNGR